MNSTHPDDQQYSDEAGDAFDQPVFDEASGGEDESVDFDEPDESEGEDGAVARQPAARLLTKGAVRRIATKTAAVSAATPKTREVAAQLLGCSTDPVDLTVAIMSATGTSAVALRELRTLRSLEGMEAAFHAAGMERSRLKAVRSLMAALGVKVPKADSVAKEGLAVAKAIVAMDDKTMTELDVASALIRKG